MSKTGIKTILILIIGALFFYTVGCVFNASFDPSRWDPKGKNFIAFVMLIIPPLVAGIYYGQKSDQ